jgi:hypothetical protein
VLQQPTPEMFPMCQRLARTQSCVRTDPPDIGGNDAEQSLGGHECERSILWLGKFFVPAGVTTWASE